MRLNGTPTLYTDRLLLRRYRLEDAQAAFSLWKKDTWDETLTGFSAHNSLKDTEKLIAAWIECYQSPNVLRWAICNQEGWIGDIGVTQWQPAHNSCELAFCLAESARHKGYMPEVLRAVTTYLFESVGFHRIALKVFPQNISCKSVAERSGFTLEGRLCDAFFHGDGVYSDILLYGLISTAHPSKT